MSIEGISKFSPKWQFLAVATLELAVFMCHSDTERKN
jgi:hypothetical protein